MFASNKKPEREINQLNKYDIIEHAKCVLCTEKEQFPDGTTEMCTVHRNRTIYRRLIRNVYCKHKQNTFQTVHKKMCIVHRNRTHYRRHIRNVYCAQGQDNLQTARKKCVLCTETDTLQTAHKKCILCTETEHFTEGT